jgi:hypothetical protein
MPPTTTKDKAGIEAHAWGQRDRIVGDEGHEEAADGGGHAGCGEHRALRHLGHAEDLRIEEDDAGLDEKGRQLGTISVFTEALFRSI